jgi:type 1 glutamine amidotransferase
MEGEKEMADQQERLQLCLLSGSFEYDSEESLALFRAYLEKGHPVQTTTIVYQSEEDNPSLKPLDETDVLLVFTRRLKTSGEELERFQQYCAQGRPIVGVRTASHAYQNWLAFDPEVLGGSYRGHYGGGILARVEVALGAESHPILQGVSPFSSRGSLYKNTPLAADTTLLLTGKTDEHEEPVAWTRVHRGGRVFYTSLGHQQDFREPDFLRLLANGVLWAASKL